MAEYSATVRTFLLSHMVNDFNEYNGYGLKNNGDFYNRNEVIEKTFDKIFDSMEIIVEIDDYFKKAFCRRFYNREIGFEVFEQFFTMLEDSINTTCFNLFKFRKKIMNIAEDEWFKTIEIKNENQSDGKNLTLTATQPQDDLSIIYPNDDKKGVIKYADGIGENYGNQSFTSLTTGSNTRPKFEMLNYYAQITPIDEQIFNILDQLLFMQIF